MGKGRDDNTATSGIEKIINPSVCMTIPMVVTARLAYTSEKAGLF